MKQLLLQTGFCFSLLYITLYANAQPGILDSSFGLNGKVLTTIKISRVYAACKQFDDKILQTGFYSPDDKPEIQGTLLIRYNKDGSIDTKFGDSGIVFSYLDTSLYYKDIFWGEKVNAQKDGGIFVTTNARMKADFKLGVVGLVKYKSTGQVDSSFGINGFAYNIFLNEDGNKCETFINTTIIQPDGSILVNGYFRPDDQGGPTYGYVLRFTKEGKPDPSFGENGMVLLQPRNSTNYSQGMALRPDGKIMLSLYSVASSSSGEAGNILVRLNSNGSYDENFGLGGIVNAEQISYNSNICLQNDNKIVVIGQVKGQPTYLNNLVMARYNEDGNADDSFGTNGKTTTRILNRNATPLDIKADAENNILVCGASENSRALIYSDFLLIRYTANGIIDSAFGINGIQLTDLTSGAENLSNDRAQTIIIQNNGSIVVSGDVLYENESGVIISLGLARYLGVPVKPRPTIAQIKRWIRNHILHFEDANTNAAYYVIEKSTANNGAFVPVTKITANAATNNYSYTLPEAATQSTYRIKAVNKDKSITYSSPISSSDPAKAGVASFKVYPNPAKERITIETSGTVQLRLQNSNGRVLLTQMVNGKGSIDINKLPNGIYYLVNTTNGESLKVVKE